MRQLNRVLHSALFSASLCFAGASHAQVTFGHLDNFQDGTTQGWGDGQGSGDNISTGGPAGAGDAYFAYTPFNKLVFFNQTTWVGNYLTAHVSRIEFDAANFGDADTLHVRVAAFSEANFSRNAFATVQSVDLPPDHSWHHVAFDLSPGAMTVVGGSLDYNTLMSSVGQLRILSAQLPSYQGDFVQDTLAVDNVRALALPGDANFSNTVDTADFTVLASHFNQTGKSWGDGDFNFDGVVNALDFNALASNFGQGPMSDPPSPGTLVPEPSTILVIGAMAIGLLNRKRDPSVR